MRATIQPSEIMIGQQALINLQVITPKGKNIQFPVYEKEIVPGVEVLAMLKPDTTIENNVMTLNFKYVVTSFDSTLYNIPRMPVFDGTDTIFSNSFGLKVYDLHGLLCYFPLHHLCVSDATLLPSSWTIYILLHQ